MDKKNFAIGAALLIAAFAALYLAPRTTPPPPVKPAPAITTTATPAGTTPAAGTATAPASAAPSAAAPTGAFATASRQNVRASIVTLENDFIAAHFTDFGGAVRDVALKHYPAELGSTAPFVLNSLHADPMLALVDFPGLDHTVAYQLVSRTSTEIVYRAVLDDRLEVTRRYVLTAGAGDKQNDPYQIRHETTFRNLADQTAAPLRVALAIGTGAPTGADDTGLQLTTGYSNGKDQTFIQRSDLESSGGFLGMGAHEARPAITSGGPLVWGAVTNQFFAAILTPDEPAAGLVTRRVRLPNTLPDDNLNAYGITGAAQFDLKALAPRAEAKLAASLYVGPKEYRRLANPEAFKADQDKVMQFGFFKYFSQILLTLMTWIHGWAPNWGVAIVLTTLTLKTIFIPFTLAASKSAKRMAKLQPQLQAIREKFKDNPQKQQAATLELFKANKVNPVGGCVPILITIPFFMGFFTMLQSAAELRFAPFLWAVDLSATDTVAHIFGLPLRIMPLLMGATMVIQMHVTPQPSVDNAQAKMMKFMPYVFTLFCYNFSSALSLYSFTNGLFTIAQQLVINKMKDDDSASPGGAAATTASTLGKAIKNVTPHKKK